MGGPGLMIAGLNGMTATAAVSGLRLMACGELEEVYGATSSPLFPAVNLPDASEWHVGGWDVLDEDGFESARRYGWFPDHTVSLRSAWDDVIRYPGVHGAADWITHQSGRSASTGSVDQLIDQVRDNILDFRERSGASDVTVAYLGSPHVDCPPAGFSTEESPASLVYARSAVSAGCDFVDFTPSVALESPGLVEAARDQGVRVAGRDLSTGQTMLKAALFEMLHRRNLVPSSWYSTNLIGNRDGEALTTPGYQDLKLQDKLGAARSLESSRLDHQVRIDFMSEWGDEKESWDAGAVPVWHDHGRIDLRVNWRGPDSFLAAPLVLDVVRLLQFERSRTGSAGLQGQLGYFFKRPFGREGTHLSARWAELVDHYSECL